MHHTAVLLSSGELYVFGHAKCCQTDEDESSPIYVSLNYPATQIVCSSFCTLVGTKRHHWYAFGSDTSFGEPATSVPSRIDLLFPKSLHNTPIQVQLLVATESGYLLQSSEQELFCIGSAQGGTLGLTKNHASQWIQHPFVLQPVHHICASHFASFLLYK